MFVTRKSVAIQQAGEKPDIRLAKRGAEREIIARDRADRVTWIVAAVSALVMFAAT